MAIGSCLATEKGKLLQKRVLAYLSLQVHRLNQKAAEHLWHSLHLEWLPPMPEEETAAPPPQSEPEERPAAPQKAPLTAQDIRSAFQAGVVRAHQRLAEKWSEQEKQHSSR